MAWLDRWLDENRHPWFDADHMTPVVKLDSGEWRRLDGATVISTGALSEVMWVDTEREQVRG